MPYLFVALALLPVMAAAQTCHSLASSAAAIAQRYDVLAANGQFDASEMSACIAALQSMDDDGARVAADLREARRRIDQGDTNAASLLLDALPETLDDANGRERELVRAELAMSQGAYGEVERIERSVLARLPASDVRNGLRARLLVARALGQRRQAQPTQLAAQDALAFAEKHFGTDSNEAAAAAVEVATAARLAGDHGASINALERAIAQQQAATQANPRVLVRALVMQAQSRKLAGDFARAAQDYETATAWLQAHPEPVPLQLAAAVHGLANLHRDNEQIERALGEYVRAESLMARAYGPESLQLAVVYNNHANALGLLERHDEALSAYQHALAIGEKQDPSGNAAVSAPLGNIALVQLWRKDFRHAEAGFRRNLEMAEKTPAGSETGALFPRLGLAAALWGQGRVAEAFAAAERAEDERYYALALTASHLGEDSAMQFQEKQRPSLDVVIAIAYASSDAKLIARAWELAMRARGQITALTAARLALARAAREPRLKQVHDAWLAAKVKLDELRLAALARKIDAPTLRAAQSTLERAERALGVASAALPAALKPAVPSLVAVRASLPAGTVLASYTSGNMRTPDEYAQRRAMQRARDVYAFVAAPGEPPRLLRLGADDTLATQASAWRELAGRPDSDRAMLLAAGRRLRTTFYDPLALPARDARIIIVPDGELYRVAFAALPADDGAFLVEHGLRFHTLNHESELLRAATNGGPNGVFALGDPRPAATASTPQRGTCAQLQTLGALPGAQREVAAIHALLPRTARWSELSGAEATEDALRARLPGNTVLHLATHALSLAADCLADSRSAGFAPLKAPKATDQEGDIDAALGALIVAPGAGDGLLSESEIAMLELTQVRWAVLSACDTGLGASRAYEGAFGLRRAFALAGARTVIMSLWRVDDTATADWMTALYRARWQEHADTLAAIYTAQRDTLRARRAANKSDHPYYWAAFVAAGDWH